MHKSMTWMVIAVCFMIMHGCFRSGPVTISAVESMQDRVNQHRIRHGCPALIWNKSLAEVAQLHSQDMNNQNYFSHINEQKQNFSDRVLAKGLDYQLVGENLAMGSSDVAFIFKGWLDSPGHRANIENCRFTHQGIGLSQTYWTHIFFTPFTQ